MGVDENNYEEKKMGRLGKEKKEKKMGIGWIVD